MWNSSKSNLSCLWPQALYLSSLYDTKETSPKLHQYFLQNPVERLSPVADLEDEILSLMLS